jgi:hypothetical protein
MFEFFLDLSKFGVYVLPKSFYDFAYSYPRKKFICQGDDITHTLGNIVIRQPLTFLLIINI